MNPLEGGSFAMDEPSGWEAGATSPQEATLQPQGPRYDLRGLIGQGGMGQVLLAYDRLLERDVAVKLLRPDLPHVEQRAARLAAEARVTAHLEHPGIVSVHDAGVGADGQPFYVMRLVRGKTLHDAMQAAAGLDGRLWLLRPLLAACEAVAYAHTRGVVHRDLKPANIMLGELGVVQVMDWGLALRPAVDTQAGVGGTIPYLSPEQADGAPPTRGGDVWSLGVILLELLVGHVPKDVRSTLRALKNAPKKHRVPAELVAIVECCLADTPSQRYSDASLLAGDLGSYLDGRRVSAFDYPLKTVVARVVRRWRVPLGVLAAALVALASVLIANHYEVVAEKDRANRHLGAALAGQAVTHFKRGRVPEAEVIAAHALALDPTLAKARGVLMASHSRVSRVASFPVPPGCHTARLDREGRRLICVGDGRARLFDLTDAALDERWSILSPATRAQILPDRGAVMLVTSDERQVLVDLHTGAHLSPPAEWAKTTFVQTQREAIGANIAGVVFLDTFGLPQMIRPCARRYQAFAVARDEAHWLAICEAGEIVGGAFLTGATPSIGHFENAAHLSALAMDGQRVVWGSARGQVGRLDITGPGISRAWVIDFATNVRTVQANPEVVVVTLEGGEVRLVSWDGHELASLPAGAATRGVEIDGSRVVTVGRTIDIWRLPTKPMPHRLSLGPSIAGAAVAGRGDRLAFSINDGRVLVTERDGSILAELRSFPDVPRSPIFSRGDRELLAAWSTRSGYLAFDVETWTGRPVSGQVLRAMASLGPDKVETIVGVAYIDPADLWVDHTAAPPLALGGVYRDIATSPDRRFAVLAAEDRPLVSRLDMTTGVLDVRHIPIRDLFTAAAITNGGTLIVGGNDDGIVFVDPETGTERLGKKTGSRVLDLAFSHDETLVASAHADSLVRLWEVETGNLKAILSGHRERVICVAFAPDDSWVMSASWDGDARFWDLKPETDTAVIEARYGLELEAVLGAAD